jgi:DNA replication and repair protein RecF
LALDRLSLEGVRNLAPTSLSPGPGINWLVGENGAGKTSVLEGIYMLGRGRSFRSARPASVIQHGLDQLRVVGRRSDGLILGIERSGDGWRGRIAGRDCQRISEFAAALPLVLFEPDSHRLIDGGPDQRRQYLDWQLFHVEPRYLAVWQRYARLLRQRNAALKSRAGGAVLDALDAPIVPIAEHLDRLRRQQVESIVEATEGLLDRLGVRLPGPLHCRYRSGFPDDRPLTEALREQRQSDLERGFTQRGPHRADLVLKVNDQAASQELSRGQQKLLALALLLAQLSLLHRSAARSPLLLLDDPVSELDQRHLETVLDWLDQQPFQSWITATAQPLRPCRMFHVEHGLVRSID